MLLCLPSFSPLPYSHLVFPRCFLIIGFLILFLGFGSHAFLSLLPVLTAHSNPIRVPLTGPSAHVNWTLHFILDSEGTTTPEPKQLLTPKIPLQLPLCWEELPLRLNTSLPEGVHIWTSGVAVFETLVRMDYFPTDSSVLLLLFEGVSYETNVSVNGVEVLAGSHRHVGMWDPFEIRIDPQIVQESSSVFIQVRVQKPSSNIAGPGTPFYSGPFPLTETLSGFLPYVWGFACGGIYRSVEMLVVSGASGGGEKKTDGEEPLYFVERETEVHFVGHANGSFAVEFEIAGLIVGMEEIVGVRLVLSREDGKIVWERDVILTGVRRRFTIEGTLDEDELTVWTPGRPYLYDIRLELLVGGDGFVRDLVELKSGFRTISIDASHVGGAYIVLNERENYSLEEGFNRFIFPRFVLSWGWHAPYGIRPDYDVEFLEAYFETIMSLGFNGVKVCLWVPSRSFYEVADRMGVLIWQELPIWKNVPTEFFNLQAPREIERIVKSVRNHPAILIWTLGCEIEKLSTEQLDSLYLIVKRTAPSSSILLGSNSGGAEAYGSLSNLDARTDFADNHFYADLEFLSELFSVFDPYWREPIPWFMGEYCDKDTLRQRNVYEKQFYWTRNDSLSNAQGSRWDMNVVNGGKRLKHFGLWNSTGELFVSSVQQAIFHRKVTFETVRKRPHLSGYVMTVDVDSPISTSGVFTDNWIPKYVREEMFGFNSDSVLLIGFDRHREWVCGGDRVSYADNYNYFDSSEVRLLPLLSHFGRDNGRVKLEYRVSLDGRVIRQDSNTTAEVLSPGSIQQIDTLEFSIPRIERPAELTVELFAHFEGEAAVIANSWKMFAFPRIQVAAVQSFSVYDPFQVTTGIRQAFSSAPIFSGLVPGLVAVTTVFDESVRGFFESGGRVILMHYFPNSLIVSRGPFWRESFQVFENRKAWGDFPLDPVGFQFLSLSTDFSYTSKDVLFDQTSVDVICVPLQTRIDARTIEVTFYSVECSSRKTGGSLIATTLRLAGGLGDSPSGTLNSVAGVSLLARWLTWMQNE